MQVNYTTMTYPRLFPSYAGRRRQLLLQIGYQARQDEWPKLQLILITMFNILALNNEYIRFSYVDKQQDEIDMIIYKDYSTFLQIFEQDATAQIKIEVCKKGYYNKNDYNRNSQNQDKIRIKQQQKDSQGQNYNQHSEQNSFSVLNQSQNQNDQNQSLQISYIQNCINQSSQDSMSDVCPQFLYIQDQKNQDNSIWSNSNFEENSSSDFKKKQKGQFELVQGVLTTVYGVCAQTFKQCEHPLVKLIFKNQIPNTQQKQNYTNKSTLPQQTQQTQKQEIKPADIFWLKCGLCLTKDRGVKYICLFCEKDQIYCDKCKDQRLDPELHQLKKIQMGNQLQVAYYRDLKQLKKKLIDENQEKGNPFSIQIKLNPQKDGVVLKQQIELIVNQTQVLDPQSISDNQKKKIPNFLNISTSDNQQAIKRSCTLVSIARNYFQNQSDKKDSLDFLKEVHRYSKQDMQNIQDCVNSENMLYCYTKITQLYRLINLSLKQKSIAQNPLRLWHLKYLISKLSNQVKDNYNQCIKDKNQAYYEKLQLFRGGQISISQYQSINQKDIIQVLGFLSTSLKYKVATDKFFCKNVLWIIRKPKNKLFKQYKGCPGYYIVKKGQSHSHLEYEVLFNVFSKFRVLKKQQKLNKDGQKVYEITLEYLELPEQINNQNIQEIQKDFNIPRDSYLIAKLQHLYLINRGQIDQGKCLKILVRNNEAKLFFYQKQNLLKNNLKDFYNRKKQETISKKEHKARQDQIYIKLASVYVQLADIFKIQNKNIYKLYAESSLLLFNKIHSKYLTDQQEQVKALIQFSYYSKVFRSFGTLNLKSLCFENKRKLIHQKLRRIGIQGTQRIVKMMGKLQTMSDYNKILGSTMHNMIKQFKQISSQKTTNVQKIVLQIADSIMHAHQQIIEQKQKNQENDLLINQQNYAISNTVIKWFQPMQNLMRYNAQSQVGELCSLKDLQVAQLTLKRCLKVLVRNQQKFIFQISQMNLILASFYYTEERYQQSKDFLNQNQKMLKKYVNQKNTLFSDHKDIKAFILAQQVFRGSQIIDQKKLQSLLKLCLQSFELKSELWGDKHIFRCTSLNNIGVVYTKTGEYNQALQYFLKAHKIYQENKSVDNKKQMKIIYNNIAQLYRLKNDVKQGQKYLKLALFIQKQQFQSKSTGFQINQGMQWAKNEIQESHQLSQFWTTIVKKSLDFCKQFISVQSQQEFIIHNYKNKNKITQ